MRTQFLETVPPVEHAQFMYELKGEFASLPEYIVEAPLWQPYYHEPAEYDGLIATQQMLQQALRSILRAYPSDDRLQRLIPASDAFLQHCQDAEDVPLLGQLIRPDYIYNTRFIFNGNILSTLFHAFLVAKDAAEPSDDMDRLAEYLHTSFYDHSAAVVRGREPYHDLGLYLQKAKGVDLLRPYECSPARLAKFGHIILELHQDELPVALDAIRAAQEQGAIVHNDPRVVQVLHDKRLLVALSDQDYMTQHIGAEAAAAMSASVVPSFHPAWEGRHPSDISHADTVVKRAISGKGDGYYLEETGIW
jgi:hypothetical protein